jgi:diguanylate cyclase (GGDEF)-like protein
VPVPILNSLLLIAEAALYFSVMAGLLRLRHQMGVGLFMSALGVMHFIETYLASSFYVELPFGILSPGSTVLFSGKLIMLLFLYMKEDAATVRQPIYGLLIGNFLVLGLVGVLSFHEVAALPNGRVPDIAFVQEMGWLMVWGTALLYIDALAIILCYEKLSRWFGQALFPRILVSAAAVLTFDQVGFYTVLYLLTDAPASVLFGGWAAKMCAALFYSVAMVAYLRWVETPRLAGPQPISDLFQVLTYREKYEKLVEDSGRDALTRLLHRGRFEPIATDMLRTDDRNAGPVSLLMIDIDHFKSINDRYGHFEGDRVLCDVAALLNERTTAADRHAFRLGGEEFAVLVQVPHSLAWLLAENIRLAVANSPEGLAKELTVSVGVATALPGRTTLAELYGEADRRLYVAKSQGRNRVVGELTAPVAAPLQASG